MQADIFMEAAGVMRSGKPAASEEAQAVVEKHRLYIDKWFYPCSNAIHSGLADMYRQDERFGKSIDKYGDGVANYLAEAIQAEG